MNYTLKCSIYNTGLPDDETELSYTRPNDEHKLLTTPEISTPGTNENLIKLTG